MSLYCDDVGPEFFSESQPIARRDHTCCECGKPIPSGMIYWYCVGKWEGDLSAFHQHIECRDACYEIQVANDFEACIPFGGLTEWIESGDDWAGKELVERVRAMFEAGQVTCAVRTPTDIAAYNACVKADLAKRVKS